MQLPDEFKTIPEVGNLLVQQWNPVSKPITILLPTPLKTSGNTDALLEQIYHHINPELYFAETNKLIHLENPSKDDSCRLQRSEPWCCIWRWNHNGLVGRFKNSCSTVDYEMATCVTLLWTKEASSLLNHRVSEVSYYGIDEDTGLFECSSWYRIQTENNRLGFDFKSVCTGRLNKMPLTMIRRNH